MAGRTIVSKTAHFALHRMELDAPAAPIDQGLVRRTRDRRALQYAPGPGPRPGPVCCARAVDRRLDSQALGQARRHPQRHQTPDLYREPNRRAPAASRRPCGAAAGRLRPQAVRERHLRRAQARRARRTASSCSPGPHHDPRRADRPGEGLSPAAQPLAGLELPLHAHLFRLFAAGAPTAWRGGRHLPDAARAWRAATPGARAGTILYRKCRRGSKSRACSPICSHPIPRRRLHERHSPHHPVGDLWFLHGDAVGPVADL